jgi:2-keto-4-pentenoate hydratase/2-oxohepta-3-ene-1,7-dioic acid hydratase in catechol pathway
VKLVSFVVPELDGGSTPEPERPRARGTRSSTDRIHTGVVVGEEIVDLADPAIGLPADMCELLAGGEQAIARATSAPRSKARRIGLSNARLVAPVPLPPKVMAIGMNYRAHVMELGRELPEHQVWFNKQRTCVVGPGAPIEIPSVSEMVDYEGELAFVIARRCRHVGAKEAPQVVAGFTIMNDVSVRDWQWRSPTWTMGKSFDTHGPLGPYLTTIDEVGDPHGLSLKTWVNGELRQDASTDDMIFSCWEMVEHLSCAFTLEPGDVISTGTPSGVGAIYEPPRWLEAGDTVRIRVEGLGELENPVVAASSEGAG